jgi:hypothetical protein
MNSLVEVLNCQGKYKEAEEMHLQASRVKETVLGKEYHSTLTGMNKPVHHVKRSLKTLEEGSCLTALGYGCLCNG